MPRRIDSAGYALIDLSDTEYLKKLVSLLRWRGFPLTRERSVQFGGGGYSQFGRWIQDGDGGGGGASGEDERYRTGAGGGFGGAHVGYALINSAWLRLYPLAGIGSVGSGYAVNPKTGDTPTYAYSMTPMVSLGLGIELRLPIARRFSPMIGVRVGYRQALKAYASQGAATADALELPPRERGGFFFRVLFGAGIRVK
jgi:hypothetical protein